MKKIKNPLIVILLLMCLSISPQPAYAEGKSCGAVSCDQLQGFTSNSDVGIEGWRGSGSGSVGGDSSSGSVSDTYTVVRSGCSQLPQAPVAGSRRMIPSSECALLLGAQQCAGNEIYSSIITYARGSDTPNRVEYSCVPVDSPQIPFTERVIYEIKKIQPQMSVPLKMPPINMVAVNIPAFFATTDSAMQEFSVSVVGNSVAVRLTPKVYTWDFGDDTDKFTTRYPGHFDIAYSERKKAMPAADQVYHRYRVLCTCQVRVTISFSAEYSVNGADFTPITGTVRAVSPPVEVVTAEARARLKLPD